MRRSILSRSFLSTPALIILSALAAHAAPRPPQDQFPPNFVPTGKVMFKQYCAACHGSDAKGHGPARAALKVPAADLTTLAKRHGGEFPTTSSPISCALAPA